MAQDPFSQSFSGIWDVLNASRAFVAVVPRNNQIRYDTSNRQPDKTNSDGTELPADRPLVRIQPNGGSELLLCTTSSTKLIKRYQILVALGDLRVNAWLNPLQFIITGALANWQDTMMSLMWNGDQFVKKFLVDDVPEGRNLADSAKGMPTWAAMYKISVEMWFTSSKLKNLMPGDITIG